MVANGVTMVGVFLLDRATPRTVATGERTVAGRLLALFRPDLRLVVVVRKRATLANRHAYEAPAPARPAVVATNPALAAAGPRVQGHVGCTPHRRVQMAAPRGRRRMMVSGATGCPLLHAAGVNARRRRRLTRPVAVPPLFRLSTRRRVAHRAKSYLLVRGRSGLLEDGGRCSGHCQCRLKKAT